MVKCCKNGKNNEYIKQMLNLSTEMASFVFFKVPYSSLSLCEKMLTVMYTYTKHSGLLVGKMQCGHLLFTGIIVIGDPMSCNFDREDGVSSKLNARLSRMCQPEPSL
jgi:hypothetical protein